MLDEVCAALAGLGAAIMGTMVSPLTGADGNVEFFVHARKQADGVVALVVHDERLQAMELAADAVAWLVERGHEVRLPDEDADATGLAAARRRRRSDLAKGLDLAVSLGGDGTMLRTVDLVAAQRRSGARRQRRTTRLPHRGRARRDVRGAREVPRR